jgi:hypothetical protein
MGLVYLYLYVTASDIVKPILMLAAIVEEMELITFISSTVATSSIVGFTVLEAVFTDLCS